MGTAQMAIDVVAKPEVIVVDDLQVISRRDCGSGSAASRAEASTDAGESCSSAPGEEIEATDVDDPTVGQVDPNNLLG